VRERKGTKVSNLFKLIERLHEHEMVAMSCSATLERFAGTLRVWVGGKEGEKSGLDREVKSMLVERCLTIMKKLVGMERDAGYESMSEEETSAIY